MRLVIAGLGALALSGCLPDGEQRQIRVEGVSELRIAPETFHINAEIRFRSAQRDEALRAASETLETIKQRIPNLNGLDAYKIETGQVEIIPVPDRQCSNNTYDTEGCPVSGFIVSIPLNLQGEPVDIAGDAVSFLFELGAERVEFDGYGLRDMQAAIDQATEQAVVNARTSAEKLAAASGSRVLSLTSITARSPQRYDEIVVTGSRTRAGGISTEVPEVRLDLAPSPITVRSSITATYEIAPIEDSAETR